MLDVNLTGTFLVTRTMSALMKSQEAIAVDSSNPLRGTTRGSIVHLGSASSFVATPKMIQYTTAKHAVLGVVKNAGGSIAVPVYNLRIRCNVSLLLTSYSP
jgi:NAD(P)-dependent dehydrogenase (short-subunit alcohol dehydrogenase family)